MIEGTVGAIQPKAAVGCDGHLLGSVCGAAGAHLV
jgi:hypothetical protein